MPQGELWEKELRIGESTYSVRMLEPRTSMRLLVNVSRVIGPALFATFGKRLQSTDATSDDDDIDLSKAANKLFFALDYALIDELMTELARVSTVNGKPLANVFDLHFQGKIGEMTRWLLYSLKVQWSDFFFAFPDLQSLIAQQIGAPPAKQGTFTTEGRERTNKGAA